MTIINEERNYRQLKESITVMQGQEDKKIDVGKVIKKKGDKSYVKWKGYDLSFNSWIDKKDLV